MTTTVRRRKPRFASGGTYGLSAGGGGAGGVIGNPTTSAATPSTSGAIPSGAAGSSSYGGGISPNTFNPSFNTAGHYSPGTVGTAQNFNANPGAYQGFSATAQGLPNATPATGQFSAGPQSSQSGEWGNAASNGTVGDQGAGGGYVQAPQQSYWQRGSTPGKYGSYQVQTTAPTNPPPAPGPDIALWGAKGGPIPRHAKGGSVQNFAIGGGFSSGGGHHRHGGGGGSSSSGAIPDVLPNGTSPKNPSYNDPYMQLGNRNANLWATGGQSQEDQENAQIDQQKAQQQQQEAQQAQQSQQKAKQQGQQQQSPRQAQQSANDNSLMKQMMGQMRQGQAASTGNGMSSSGAPSSSDASSAGGDDSTGPADSSAQPQSGDAMTGGDAAAAGAQAGAAAGGLAKGGSVKVKEEPYRNKWRAKNGKKQAPYRAFDEGGGVSPEYNDATGSGMGFAEGGTIPETEDDLNTSDSSQGDVNPLLGVQQALSYTRQKFGLDDSVFQQMASNSGPIQPSPGTGGKPAQGTLPPPPINPRDYLPGGKKASDAGGDTASAKKGGAIPDHFDAGGGVGEGGLDPGGNTAMGAALSDGGNGLDSTLYPDEVPNTPSDPSTKAIQKKLMSESKSDEQEPDDND
jgi:hypothetical protein